MTKILTGKADELQIIVRSPSPDQSSSTISFHTAIAFQGSKLQLEDFYKGLPSIVNALESRFESHSEDLSLASFIKFWFKAELAGGWFGPLVINLEDPTSIANGTYNSQMTISGEKSSNFLVRTYNTVGLQSNSPSMFSSSRANNYLPFLNTSFASIHNNLLEKKLRSAEWQESLQSKALDHSTSNLKFNFGYTRQLSHHRISPNLTAVASPQNYPSGSPNKAFNPAINFEPITRASSDESKVDRLPLKSQFIIMVSGTDWRKHGAKELCNLFTNYGNIELAVCIADGSGMFLSYLSKQGVEYALQCLHGVELDGDLLSLKSVNNSFLRDCLASCEFSSFAPRKRFSSKGPGLPNRVNPISRTLHVTYHHDRADRQLSDDTIHHCLETFGQIVRIKREIAPKKKNMWFVEFLSEASAIRAVMKQHNKLYMGGTLRISFTKTI
jgi:hypothetical protein